MSRLGLAVVFLVSHTFAKDVFIEEYFRFFMPLITRVSERWMTGLVASDFPSSSVVYEWAMIQKGNHRVPC